MKYHLVSGQPDPPRVVDVVAVEEERRRVERAHRGDDLARYQGACRGRPARLATKYVVVLGVLDRYLSSFDQTDARIIQAECELLDQIRAGNDVGIEDKDQVAGKPVEQPVMAAG